MVPVLIFSVLSVTGNLSSVTAPSGSVLSHTYDGTLPLSTTWSGPVSGSVSRAYDVNFRVSSQGVNGANPIAFQYDADSLLTKAGDLTLSRHPQHGLLTGTTLGTVTDTLIYNGFGERAAYAASIGGSPTYTALYTRDTLGRITQKTETIGGVTTTFRYAYDAAEMQGHNTHFSMLDSFTNRLGSRSYTYDVFSRLTQATHPSLSGLIPEAFSYDSVGNRLSSHLSMSYAYDLANRLLEDDTFRYTYDLNGNLVTKTRKLDNALTQYTYEVESQLISVERGADSVVPLRGARMSNTRSV